MEAEISQSCKKTTFLKQLEEPKKVQIRDLFGLPPEENILAGGFFYSIMVCGVWCVVYGVWCMVYGVWCMVYCQFFTFALFFFFLHKIGLFISKT